MNWYRSLEASEFIFIGFFVLLYILYLLRVFITAKKLGSNSSPTFVKLILRALAFALIIIAILGPSFGESQKEIKAMGKDIYIAVDLSQSMNATDIQPTRLEKVKYELKEIAEAFNSDRIGIIIFSNEAFIQCPLTYDQSALNLWIEALHTNLVPNTGTDFAPPLEMVISKLEKDENFLSQQKSKIMILISDGEDFGEKTKNAAKEMEDLGVKLFTLGVGTERGSKIRVRNGFKKDQSGKEVVSKLNPKSLKTLAASTGGKYFEISETNNDVSRLINVINSIEGELKDARKLDVSANKYYYFLALAALLLFLDVLISIKTFRL